MMLSLLMAGALSAFAPDPQALVGVAPVVVSGERAAHIDELLATELDNALGAAAIEHRALTGDWLSATCEAASCRAEAMQGQGLDYVLRASVTMVERDYDSTLQIFDRRGELAGELESSCEICTPDEAAQQLGREATELIAAIEAPPEQGPEPEAAPEPPPVLPGRISSQDKARYVGYGLAGAGLVGLVSGITMIALEERNYGPKCDGENTDSNGACEYRHQTVEGGTVLTVIGGLAAGAGATLIVLTRKGGRANLALAPFGQGLKLKGIF